MSDDIDTPLPQLFARIFSESAAIKPPSKWDFNDLEYNPVVRQRVLSALEQIVIPIKPNFLIGFDGHLNFVIMLGNSMKIGYTTSLKHRDHENPNAKEFTAIFNENHLNSIQSNLGEHLRLVLVDDSIMSGYSASRLIEAVRKSGFVINDAVFLVEDEGKGGREKLASIGVKAHSLVRHSPENGFQSGISGAEAEAIIKVSAEGSPLGTSAMSTAVSQKYKRLPREITTHLTPRHTRAHEWRPGSMKYSMAFNR